jgi:hypothetical protein
MKACVARDELFGWDGDIDEAEDLDTEGYDSFYTEDEDGNLVSNPDNPDVTGGDFADPSRKLSNPGADCALGKTFRGVDNVWFYNYAYRYRVNALMDQVVDEEEKEVTSGGSWGNKEWDSSERVALQAEFQTDDANSAYGLGNLHCGNMHCTSVPLWFINKYTNLTHGAGNGRDVAGNLARVNGGSVSSTPTAPAIFSVIGGGYDPTYGHTGLVLKVNDDGSLLTLESGGSACSFIGNTVYPSGTWSFYNISEEQLK